MTHELDETDRRILHALMEDARHTSATELADELGVSDATIHNRIDRLESEGIIRGYRAMINFERAGGYLIGIYMCTVPAADRERLAIAARAIPEVINVRVLMAGKRDLQVVAVGEQTEDLQIIARELSALDITIEDEELVQTELWSPYELFEPESDSLDGANTISLANGTDIFEVPVEEGAPIVGHSIDEAREQEYLSPETNILLIERETKTLDPDGETVIQVGDIVTLVPHADRQNPLDPFSPIATAD
ncbi:AsnC family transcriptional regulator [Halobacteriales archaeon QH_10_67_13]|nr:MAG: AsnC family transcriptional regulator [Halobacteriales archaeon QH_10_67_13]